MTGLCLVCSIVVSVAAVGLRPAQLENKALDKQSNIPVRRRRRHQRRGQA